MVRLKDVAYLAGYDISTASKVLQGGNIQVSDEARERILNAARDLGYRPNLLARGLRTHRAGAIVLALPRLDNPVYPALTQGAEVAAQRLGLAMFAYKFPENDPSQSLLNLVLQGRVDGILLVDELPDPTFLQSAKEQGVPFVSLNRQTGQEAVSVVLDDQAGFAVQASYLMGLGHSNIAYVSVKPESPASHFCRAAFLQTLEAAGTPIEEDYVLFGRYDAMDIRVIISELLLLDPLPTAVATASIQMAVRLIQGLTEHGIHVPEDMSVIGYHDAEMSEWTNPQATTIRMPSFEQGIRGVERLHGLISGQTGESQEIISTPIMVVERGSCARRR